MVDELNDPFGLGQGVLNAPVTTQPSSPVLNTVGAPILSTTSPLIGGNASVNAPPAASPVLASPLVASSGIDQVKRSVLNRIYSGESNSYGEIYGGGTFSDFSDHPRQRQVITEGPHKGEYSDAAGAPQFLSSTWDMEKKKLGLKDFSPASQDAAAWDLANTTYKFKTGGDLATDAAAGKVQWGALADQWPSLAGAGEAGGFADWRKGGTKSPAGSGGAYAKSATGSSAQSTNGSPAESAIGGGVTLGDPAALVQDEMKLELLRNMFPQHKIEAVGYDPWKVMPQGGTRGKIDVNTGEGT